MSGVFDPAQQISVTATDDPELAKRFGLTEWDEARGQYVAPKAAPAAESTPEPEAKASAKTTKVKASGDTPAI